MSGAATAGNASAGVATRRPRLELVWVVIATAALLAALVWTARTPAEAASSAAGPAAYPAFEAARIAALEDQAWSAFDAQEVSRGRLPTWNRFDGYGVPHLANPRSAVASPFTLPYYVVGTAVAAWISAAAKLGAAALFTYLFLRRVRLAPLACAFGAVVFACAGHQLLHLWDARSAAAVVIPAGLWAVERAAQAWESARRAGDRGSWSRLPVPKETAVVALVLIAGLATGHLAGFACALATIVAYALARGFALHADHGAETGARAALARWSVQLAAVGALSFLVCAWLVVPFLGYVRESHALVHPSGATRVPLAAATWATHAFPFLPGDARGAAFGAEVLASSFAGLMPLVLACLAPFVVRGRRLAAFFAAAALVWIACAYDVLGAACALPPALDSAPRVEGQPVFVACVAILAAMTVDRFLAASARSRLGAGAAFVGLAIVVLAVFRAGAWAYVRDAWLARAAPADAARFSSRAAAHVSQVSWAFAGAALALGVAIAARGAWTRRVAVVAALVATWAHASGLFVPLVPAMSHALERAEAASTREVVGAGTRAARHVFLGPSPLPAHRNALHGVESIAVRDGLGIDRFEVLRRRFFGGDEPDATAKWPDARALQLFGIEIVLADVDRRDAAAERARFVSAGRVGRYEAWRHLDAVPRVHTVSHAYAADGPESALSAVSRARFDPARIVALEGVDPATSSLPRAAEPPDEAATIEAEDHGHVRISAPRARPGWLVVDQPWYPGWKAFRNGAEVPLLRANYAFCAVPLEAGANVVELTYEPSGVRLGAWCSVLALLVLATWLWASHGGARGPRAA